MEVVLLEMRDLDNDISNSIYFYVLNKFPMYTITYLARSMSKNMLSTSKMKRLSVWLCRPWESKWYVPWRKRHSTRQLLYTIFTTPLAQPLISTRHYKRPRYFQIVSSCSSIIKLQLMKPFCLPFYWKTFPCCHSKSLTRCWCLSTTSLCWSWSPRVFFANVCTM